MDQAEIDRRRAALAELAELTDTKGQRRHERKMLSFIERLRRQGFTITDHVFAVPVALEGKLPTGEDFYLRCRYQACRLTIDEEVQEQLTKLDGTPFEKWEAGCLTTHQAAKMLAHLLGKAGRPDAQRRVRAATA